MSEPTYGQLMAAAMGIPAEQLDADLALVTAVNLTPSPEQQAELVAALQKVGDRGVLVTGHNEEKSPEAKRKEAERLRDIEMGIERVELKLSVAERAALDEARALRGGYSITEYLATLVRKDLARAVAELDKIKAERCERCGVELPGGCLAGSDRERKGLGRLQGEAGCWRTYNALRLHL